MKEETLLLLQIFEKDLRDFRKELKGLDKKTVNRKALQDKALNLASRWDNEINPVLKNIFKLPENILKDTTNHMQRLYVLARPNNQVSSYLQVIDNVLKDFKDKFVLPIQKLNTSVKGIPQLHNLLSQLKDAEESNYIKEAIECAQSGFYRASIVLGWCAVTDRFQRKIQSLGFDKFSQASTKVKNISTGKFKRWTKEFSIQTLSELQTIFDPDLIIIFEGGFELIDSNQASRLEVLFDWRNQSAHPGNAPIDEPHLVAFFYDIINIVFTNEKFSI